MLREFIKNGVGVEGDKLVTANPTISTVSFTLNQVLKNKNLRVHGLNILGVGPEAVMDRCEGDSPGPEEEGGEHHM